MARSTVQELQAEIKILKHQLLTSEERNGELSNENARLVSTANQLRGIIAGLKFGKRAMGRRLPSAKS